MVGPLCCILCKTTTEDLDHIMWNRDFAHVVWSEFFEVFGFRFVSC